MRLSAERYVGCLRTIRRSTSDILEAESASLIAKEPRYVDEIHEAITDLRMQLSQVELSKVGRNSTMLDENGHRLTRICLDRMCEQYPVKSIQIPEANSRHIESYENIRSEGGKIEVPLGYDGTYAQNWVPLFETIITNIYNINEDLYTIQRRIVADGDPNLSEKYAHLRQRMISVQDYQKERYEQLQRKTDAKEKFTQLKYEQQ